MHGSGFAIMRRALRGADGHRPAGPHRYGPSERRSGRVCRREPPPGVTILFSTCRIRDDTCPDPIRSRRRLALPDRPRPAGASKARFFSSLRTRLGSIAGAPPILRIPNGASSQGNRWKIGGFNLQRIGDRGSGESVCWSTSCRCSAPSSQDPFSRAHPRRSVFSAEVDARPELPASDGQLPRKSPEVLIFRRVARRIAPSRVLLSFRRAGNAASEPPAERGRIGAAQSASRDGVGIGGSRRKPLAMPHRKRTRPTDPLQPRLRGCRGIRLEVNRAKFSVRPQLAGRELDARNGPDAGRVGFGTGASSTQPTVWPIRGGRTPETGSRPHRDRYGRLPHRRRGVGRVLGAPRGWQGGFHRGPARTVRPPARTKLGLRPGSGASGRQLRGVPRRPPGAGPVWQPNAGRSGGPVGVRRRNDGDRKRERRSRPR